MLDSKVLSKLLFITGLNSSENDIKVLTLKIEQFGDLTDKFIYNSFALFHLADHASALNCLSSFKDSQSSI